MTSFLGLGFQIIVFRLHNPLAQFIYLSFCVDYGIPASFICYLLFAMGTDT